MSRQIDVEEAKSWSAKELEENLKYLEDRGRTAEADRARELASDSKVNKADAGLAEAQEEAEAQNVTATEPDQVAQGADPGEQEDQAAEAKASKKK